MPKIFNKKLKNKKEKDIDLTNSNDLSLDFGDSWIDYDQEEGQLSIDVYQTKDDLIVKSTIAGANIENIEIFLQNDMLTIRGKRDRQEKIHEGDYLYKECYWGKFSRTIILPFEVKSDKIKASLQQGVLTITLPKTKREDRIFISLKK
jgi:HSP20 family protein